MARVQAQIPDDIQAAANEVFRSNGLSMSDGVRMFIRLVAESRALPLDLLQPNAETLEAMEELESGGGTKTTLDGLSAMIRQYRADA
jgi:DNA-damage-inducible protein J